MAQFTTEAQSIPAGIRSNSATALTDIGAKAVTTDGRSFRYVKCGATAIVAGKVYDGPAIVANHTNATVAAAAAAGATSFTATLGATAATANQYAWGVAVVNDVDGEGFTYSIDNHAAVASAGVITANLTADESIVTALTTSSQVTFVANQYNGVIIHATTETGVPVGVGHTQITAAQYGWIQTRGPVAILCNATTALGQSVAASDTTNAGGAEIGDGILPVIGYQLAAGVATEYNPVFLTID